MDLDPGLGVADPVGARRNLQADAGEGDGIVIGHCSLMFETEDLVAVQVGWQGTILGARFGGWFRKSFIEDWQELSQGGIGFGQ
jgi:hypothetical protein